MASVGLQTAVTCSIQHCVLLSDRRTSSTSPGFSGRGLPLLKSACKGWRNTREASGTDRYCFGAHATSSIVGPILGPSTNAVETDKEKTLKAVDGELLACPLCYRPLLRKGIPGLTQRAISRSGFQCLTCQKAYSSRYTYLDLTVTADSKVYSETQANGTELFRSPLVSYAYERGWRQNFERAGFPGPDEEVKMAQEYLKPTYGGVLLDVSCGSGLFTRRFASLDLYSAVIAIDFSENMLRQTYDYIKQDEALLNKTIALVRADVARMPFATGSVDAIHAGAALHCWPSPVSGMAEISRILRPGGVFVATTFLAQSPFNLQVFARRPQSTSLRYWQEAELEELMRICGLVNYQRMIRHQFINQGFIMLMAQKPE